MSKTLQRVLGAAIGTAAEAFIGSAGKALERGLVPPDDHRPWPAPRTAWAMTQSWEHMLFAHWAVRPNVVRPLLPRGLRLDTFREFAWIGITAFMVTGARLHGLPAVPGFSEFAEVNVRTYVTADGKPGVFFFSLDAGSALTVLGASAWYALPYFMADARLRVTPHGVRFRSRRDHAGAPAAEFVAEYRATGPVRTRPRARLSRWLTERYCAYTLGVDGGVARTEIHHAPWPLQTAEVTITSNSLLAAAGLDVAGPPRFAHYAAGVDALIWPPVPAAARAA